MDDLKSSRSIRGTDGPNFELLDARIASALNKIIQNTRFKKKVSLEEMTDQKEDRFLRGRQIAYLIYEYLRVTGANDSVENYADLLTVVLRLPCKDYLKGTCTNSFCEKWHHPECLFYKSENGCRFGEKCSYAHRQVEEQPRKRSRKNSDKSAVVVLKKYEQHDRTGQPVVYDSSNTRQLGCVCQDMEPPKSSSILRKSSNIRKPIRRVKFTKAVVRHANIRDQNPSLGMICPGDPHQRNHNASKFEDRSQEETEWQERCAREAAWKLAKNILKLKEKHNTAFFSLSEKWCLPASTLKPEERELVVDSRASMHMISKKDLNSDEMETVTTSRSPTTAITANGEVQTHEEATVYVTELDIFSTMKVLEDAPAVFIAWKALR